jgi:hypothetical protein
VIRGDLAVSRSCTIWQWIIASTANIFRAAVNIMQYGWPSSKSFRRDLRMHGADKRMTQPEAMKRSHPSIRNKFVMVGYLLAQGAKYTISVAAAVGDQERIEQLLHRSDGATRRDVRYLK